MATPLGLPGLLFSLVRPQHRTRCRPVADPCLLDHRVEAEIVLDFNISLCPLMTWAKSYVNLLYILFTHRHTDMHTHAHTSVRTHRNTHTLSHRHTQTHNTHTRTCANTHLRTQSHQYANRNTHTHTLHRLNAAAFIHH